MGEKDDEDPELAFAARVHDSLVANLKRERREIAELTAFLDACKVPEKPTLLERVRDFYNGCTDTVNKYRDRLGELPNIIDPREAPFLAGWEAASQAHGHHHGSLHPGLAPPAFRRWAAEDDKKKGFPK